MHKTESNVDNETHRILWDLETQMDNQIQVRKPDLLLIFKKREIVV